MAFSARLRNGASRPLDGPRSDAVDTPVVCYGDKMPDDTHEVFAATVSRIPEWVRKELLATDQTTRTRAEETVAAMIADALASLQG